MYSVKSYKSVILFGLTVFLVTAMISCNERGSNPLEINEYRFEGILVVDQNPETSVVTVTVDRNDSLLATADISVGGNALTFASPGFQPGFVYSFTSASATVFTGDVQTVSISDADRLSDSFSVSVADTFAIIDVVPPNRLIQGLGTASLTWSEATGTSAYVYAAVKADDAHTGLGYSAYSLTGATGATVPMEAFQLEGGNDPDTGLYNLYVYAITGAPDTSFANELLPVPLPDQLPDNISREKIAGHFGSVVVTLADTVRVATLTN